MGQEAADSLMDELPPEGCYVIVSAIAAATISIWIALFTGVAGS